jgi:hypothetical protein
VDWLVGLFDEVVLEHLFFGREATHYQYLYFGFGDSNALCSIPFLRSNLFV